MALLRAGRPGPTAGPQRKHFSRLRRRPSGLESGSILPRGFCDAAPPAQAHAVCRGGLERHRGNDVSAGPENLPRQHILARKNCRDAQARKPLMDFTELIDLAAERLGGAVLAANDEFFAPKENLLKPGKPIFIEGKYTDVGKWMDGWETRRRRTPGFDWCIIRLGLPGILRGVVVDTSHFKGNYPEHCSIEACVLDGHPDVGQLTSASTQWTELLPKSSLSGDAENPFAIDNPQRFTHLRFKIYPDGGVARPRVYGEVVPDWTRLGHSRSEVDLAAVESGGVGGGRRGNFFCSRPQPLMPRRAAKMNACLGERPRGGAGDARGVIQPGNF